MKKRLWILFLFVVVMFSAVGASFAQLRSGTTPAIICNDTCEFDSQCGGICPTCVRQSPDSVGKCQNTQQ